MASPSPITRLLVDWRRGSSAAFDELVPLVYDELRSLARRHLRSERPDQTLSATAVVHEAYGRLVGSSVDWQDRVHFFAVASNVMRRVLVDHARAHRRKKRGGDALRVTLVDDIAETDLPQHELVLALDGALERLEQLDERRAKALELHYFAGLSYDDAAEILGVSRSTLNREIRLAKAWLKRELS